MTITQNKNVRQLVWNLQYVDTAVEGSGLYCYNTECDRNSVESQASCRMDVTRLEHEMSNLTYVETGGIGRLPHRWQRNLDALGGFL